MFVMVDYEKEMTVKKSCKYGKYGSFEHLLFLFCCINNRLLNDRNYEDDSQMHSPRFCSLHIAGPADLHA